MNRPVGRPRKITGHIARKIFLLAAYGLTEEQIAEVLGMTNETIRATKENEDFSATIQRAKEFSDLAVENALYHRAVGYVYEEEYPSEDGVISCKKYMHPDVQAIRFWLKNRQRKKWRDVILDESPGQSGVSVYNLTQVFANTNKEKQEVISRGQDPLKALFGEDYKPELNGHNGTS